MGKDQGPGATDVGCTCKSSHLVASDPYDWLPAGRCASEAPSSAYEQRWTLEMVAAVEVVMVHPRLTTAGLPPVAVLDPTTVPTLACNTSL